MPDTGSLLSDLNAILGDYSKNVVGMVDEECHAAAKECKQILTKTSPKRSGDYAKSWRVKKVNGYYVVYNTKPGLTHLLEDGHDVIVNGKKVGRAPAHPHIKTAEKEINDVLVERITQKLEDGGGWK